MSDQTYTVLQSKLTAKQRISMVLCPCKYLNIPSMDTRDCCLCCHEAPKYQSLNISPFIEIAGTCVTPANPIDKNFVIFRFITMSYVIYVAVMSFSIEASEDEGQYWLMYFTEWNAVCAVLLNTLRFISSYKIYKVLKSGKLQVRDLENLNEDNTFDTDNNLWLLYKCHKIVLYTVLPTITMVVINYWTFVYTWEPNYYSSQLKAVSAIQKHGISALVIWIDFIISTEKMYYKSVIWSLGMGTVYTFWTILFELFIKVNENGDPYIYSAYDWSASVPNALFYYFVSLFILALLTWMATFIKNIILMNLKAKIGTQGIGIDDDEYTSDEPLDGVYV